MKKQILHIDVNNAFLSWSAVELLKQGEKVDIKTIPAIIFILSFLYSFTIVKVGLEISFSIFYSNFINL